MRRAVPRQRGRRSAGCCLLLVLWACVCVGCGAGVGRRGTSTVAMDPIRVTASRTGDEDVAVDAYDARELLRRGNAALAERRCADALEAFDRLG